MKPSRLPDLARARGFTLVEAIIVIVLTGVLSSMVATFIGVPMQSYADSAARAELSDAADLALRRISRELRLALPNSIVVGPGGTSIQFLITKTGGRYVAIEDDAGAAVIDRFDFGAAGDASFDLVGAAPGGRQRILPGDFIVVYNLGTAPADAYSGGNVSTVTGINGNRITMANKVFPNESPRRRFQIVTGTVTYLCDVAGRNLTRFYANAIPAAATPEAPPGTPALLANRVTGCQFTFDQNASLNTALIGLTLTLDRATGGNAVTLVRQVHVDNSP